METNEPNLNKEQIMKDIRESIDKMMARLDEVSEGEDDPRKGFLKLRRDFELYPDMVEQVLDHAGLVQGALSDMGMQQFISYANIVGFAHVLSASGAIPTSAVPAMLTEIMKYCILRGILYGMELQKQDNELFSDFVNEL